VKGLLARANKAAQFDRAALPNQPNNYHNNPEIVYARRRLAQMLEFGSVQKGLVGSRLHIRRKTVR
jgi:hypothetical protein